MATVTGNFFIYSPPHEHASDKGHVDFQFIASGRNPYLRNADRATIAEERNRQAYYYRFKIWVPRDHVEAARKVIAKGNMIELRMGELEGVFGDMVNLQQLSEGALEKIPFPMNRISTQWKFIEAVRFIPTPKE